MGREIRRVPPNWEHPKTKRYDGRTRQMEEFYQPLYDRDVETEFAEWTEEYQAFVNGGLDEILSEHYPDVTYSKDAPYAAFCEWHGPPPNPEYHRPAWKDGEATWYQVYETVSEGTPVTPPFETQGELIDYLVENGDFWDQKRRKDQDSMGMPCDPWSRKGAEAFVLGDGYLPSMVVAGGKILSGSDLAEFQKNTEES